MKCSLHLGHICPLRLQHAGQPGSCIYFETHDPLSAGVLYKPLRLWSPYSHLCCEVQSDAVNTVATHRGLSAMV